MYVGSVLGDSSPRLKGKILGLDGEINNVDEGICKVNFRGGGNISLGCGNEGWKIRSEVYVASIFGVQ